MAQMYGKKLFTGVENVRGFFALDIAPVYEIEYPWRICEHALYFHIWPGKALVAGIWNKNRIPLEKHLLAAMRGRIHDKKKEGLREWVQPEGLRQGSPEVVQALSKGTS
jgi:hypothetical protein